MSGVGWRPLHRGLPLESSEVIAWQVENGIDPAPVHLMLVDDGSDVTPAPHKLACGEHGLGDWITGAPTEVTCRGCQAGWPA